MQNIQKVKPLSIQVSTGDARPIFKQIVDQVRMLVARNELEVGAKLPSVRGLATQLLVNANTVAKAYNELTSQGVLESHQGKGLFVAQQRQMLSQEAQQRKLDSAVEVFVNEVAYLDYSQEKLLSSVANALESVRLRKVSNGE